MKPFRDHDKGSDGAEVVCTLQPVICITQSSYLKEQHTFSNYKLSSCYARGELINRNHA